MNLSVPAHAGLCRRVNITYIDKEGKEHTVAAPIGKSLLEVAHDNEIDLEGGAAGFCPGRV